MDFALSGDQEMLKALVERFVADRYAGTARAAYRATPAGFAADNWALLAELGLLALPFAESSGGLDGGGVEIITAMQALGRGLVAEPFLDSILVGGRLLEQAGSAAQQAEWLPRIMDGQARVALAWAEHGGRFNPRHCATLHDDGRLTGHKTFVPAGADVLIVTARPADGTSGAEPHLYLVAADAPGLSRREYRVVDGSVASEIGLDATPAAAMPGGFAALDAVIQTARIAACAEMVGLMDLLLDTTLDYVRQRQQFGTAIGSFQAIQHRLADVYAGLELARSQLYRGVLAAPGDAPAAIAAAKSYIARAAIHLGEECIQFHGGMGVSDDLAVGHAHKRILALASFFGDADHELARYNRALESAAAA